jgi:cold shock CspA family protein
MSERDARRDLARLSAQIARHDRLYYQLNAPEIADRRNDIREGDTVQIRRAGEDYPRKRRGEVKSHPEPAHGWISELDAEHDIGRIESDDGRRIHFHRNSLIGGRFKDLTTGIEVRFAEEPGDHGPEASTVHVIS